MEEYAPLYTKKERYIRAFKIMAWALPILVIGEFWFFDWLTEYSRKAHCYNFGKINGQHLIFYGNLVVLPLLLAFIFVLIEGPRSIKILKLGQNPLPNEKMLTKTKYKYGLAAKVQPLSFFFVIILLMSTSIWGFFMARELTEEIKPCTANKTFEPLPMVARTSVTSHRLPLK